MKILKFSEESIKFGARRSGFESCSCQMLAVWWSETSILITLALLYSLWFSVSLFLKLRVLKKLLSGMQWRLKE